MTDPAGFTGKAFQTAAARRGTPLQFQVEHLERDPENDDDMGTMVTYVLMVDPMLDIVRLGKSFGAFGKTLGGFNDESVSDEEKLQRIDVEVPRIREALRQVFTPPSRAKWDKVATGFDLRGLGEVIRWLTGELSGLDPTQQRSSSSGSDETGTPSTAGAPLEASTPPESPSLDA